MSDIPTDYKYTTTHEWLRVEDDGLIALGITDNAQSLLGDLVFVELPEVGTTVSDGDECGVVESVKAASDIYSPINGEIAEINEKLAENPEIINHDPYGDGWILKIAPESLEELNDLLTADAYAEHISAEDE